MRRTIAAFALAATVIMGSNTPAEASKSLQSVAVSGGLTLPVYTSSSIDVSDPVATRAVIVVHGTSGNATDYYDYAATAVAPGTFIAAPRFRTSASGTALYWTSTAWKEGGASTNSPYVSSFVAMDALVAKIQATRPNVTSIVIIGHSAGGQFVQRYAATSTNPRVRFIVANAGSYMYLTAAREGYTNPASGCSRYNRYRYGLEVLPAQLSGIGAATLNARYRAADVTYLLGDMDTDPNDPDMDTGCAATRQGPYRYERGQRFYRSLGATAHQLVTVTGCLLYTSPSPRDA